MPTEFAKLLADQSSHCRASGAMAIFLGVSAAPERILLSKISYAPVQHSSLHQKVLLWAVIQSWGASRGYKVGECNHLGVDRTFSRSKCPQETEVNVFSYPQ